jgi:hypothetical protein
MKILTVFHNYYEQILTTFILCFIWLYCSNRSVCVMKKKIESSMFNKLNKMHLPQFVINGTTTFSAIFSSALKGAKVDGY